MSRGLIDCVIVGADRIARNGDVANKLGTFPVALAAQRFGVPFYVAAPYSTLDGDIERGEDIPIEERGADEVTHVFGCEIAPSGVAVFNPAFDVTPAEFIAAIVTDRAVHRPPYGASLFGAG
jgi:methylthioribose-1-phosphate isomerase